MIISKLSLILPCAQRFAQVLMVLELDQLIREILQIVKKWCILNNYRVKFVENGKILIPNTGRRNSNSSFLEFSEI